MEQEEEIKRMSEETAQKLTEAFEDINSAAKSANDLLGTAAAYIASKAIVNSAEQLYKTMEKASKANFLTRWYWKLRVIKDFDHLTKAVEFANEVRNMFMDEPQKEEEKK